MTFSALGAGGGWGWAAIGGHTSLCIYVTAQKPFVSLKKAQQQTLCSLLTSDMLDIASKFMLNTSCTDSGTSVACKRKW